MSAQRIADRYAKSLIELAQEKGKLDRVTEDVQSFAEAVKNRDFYLLLKSPIVNADKKKAAVKAIFGDSFDDMTMAFLNILVDKGRESLLPEIAREYDQQYKKMKHISVVTVTTAEPITEEALNTLRQKLQASGTTDENIIIETRIDPEVIGGFVLQYDGKIYDASVAQKLDELKKEFVGNLYVSKVSA